MNKIKNILNSKLTDRLIKYWLPIIVWSFIIFILSSQPTGRALQVDIGDFILKKSAHIIEYAILTVLLYRATKESGIEKKEAMVYSIILATLYGFSDEFHQSFTPGRDPRLRDVAFDFVGSISSMVFVNSYLAKSPQMVVTLAKKLKVL